MLLITGIRDICVKPSGDTGYVYPEKSYFESKIFLVDNFWGQNRAWQEIANIVNAGHSVKRDIKEIQKKMGQYMCYRKH
jgi:hypothetical protein